MNSFYAGVIADLRAGKTKQIRGKGNSMVPRIYSGQKQTLVPITDPESIKAGDMVFCKVNGNVFTHLVTGIRGKFGEREFQISNNHGHVNGWTRHVFGKCVAVED